jgi:hypothetical protein
MQYTCTVWTCIKSYKYQIHLHATKINSLQYMYKQNTPTHSKSSEREATTGCTLHLFNTHASESELKYVCHLSRVRRVTNSNSWTINCNPRLHFGLQPHSTQTFKLQILLDSQCQGIISHFRKFTLSFSLYTSTGFIPNYKIKPFPRYPIALHKQFILIMQ